MVTMRITKNEQLKIASKEQIKHEKKWLGCFLLCSLLYFFFITSMYFFQINKNALKMKWWKLRGKCKKYGNFKKWILFLRSKINSNPYLYVLSFSDRGRMLLPGRPQQPLIRKCSSLKKFHDIYSAITSYSGFTKANKMVLMKSLNLVYVTNIYQIFRL